MSLKKIIDPPSGPPAPPPPPRSGPIVEDRTPADNASGPSAAPRSSWSPITGWLRPNTGPITPPSSEILRSFPQAIEWQMMVAGVNAPLRLLYGRVLVGAQVLRALPNSPLSGTRGLVICAVWGAGIIDAVEQLYIDDVPLNVAVPVSHYLGTLTQTANTGWFLALQHAGATPVLADVAMPGVAYSIVTLPEGANIGTLSARIRGRRVFDPRIVSHDPDNPTTWAWSENPALHLADVLRHPRDGAGLTVQSASIIAAANACEVPAADSTQKRLAGMVLDEPRPLSEWIEPLRAQAGCFVVRSAAQVKLIPDTTGTSAATFTAAQILQGSMRWQVQSAAEVPNVVEVTYTDRTAVPWTAQRVSYPLSGVPSNPAERIRKTSIALTGVYRRAQAYREALEAFNLSRAQRVRVRFAVRPGVWQAHALERGDLFTLSDGGPFDGTIFRVADVQRGPTTRPIVEIEGVRYDAAAYSGAVIDERTPISALPSPQDVPPGVASLTARPVLAISDRTRALQGRLRISWAEPSYLIRLVYDVIVYAEFVGMTSAFSGAEVFSSAVTGSVVETGPLPAGRYRVVVRSRTALGYVSAPAEISVGLDLPVPSETITVKSGVVAALTWVTAVVVSNPKKPPFPQPGWDAPGGAVTTTTSYFEAIDALMDATHIVRLSESIEQNRDRRVFVEGLPDVLSDQPPHLWPIAQRACLTDDRVVSVKGRYVRVVVQSRSGGGHVPPVSAVPSTVTVSIDCQVSTSSVQGTSSASADVEVTLPDRFAVVQGAAASANANAVTAAEWTRLSDPVYAPQRYAVGLYGQQLGSRVALPFTLAVWGAMNESPLTDWASARTGGTASASSEISGYSAASAIRGSRRGDAWSSDGGWNSLAVPGSDADPWIEVTLASAKRIAAVVLTHWHSGSDEPRLADFSATNRLEAYRVRVWDGTTWHTVATVTSNSEAVRFHPVAASIGAVAKVRIDNMTVRAGYARLIAIEALGLTIQ